MEKHIPISERKLEQLIFQKKKIIDKSRLGFNVISDIKDRMILDLEANIWSEVVEDLTEIISTEIPESFKEYIKCLFYYYLVRDWNHTNYIVCWLKDKFPVKYKKISRKCHLRTIAKYPNFNYIPLPEEKFGKHVFQTIDLLEPVEEK